jgi:hypothetical protein
MAYANWETLETDIEELKVFMNFLKEHRANPKPVDYSKYPENEREHWKRVFENKNKHGLAELSTFRKSGLNEARNKDGIEVGYYGPGFIYFRGPKGEIALSASGGYVKNGYWACGICMPFDASWRPIGQISGVRKAFLTEDEVEEVKELIYDALLLFEVKAIFKFDAYGEAAYRTGPPGTSKMLP